MIAITLLLLILTVAEGANICNQRDTTSPTGDVASPNYPTNYPVSQTCSFTITVSTGQSIVISFKAMDLEQDEDDVNSCYDYVEILDLVTNDKTRHCGKNLPADFTSKSNRVQISFVSDFSDAGELKPTGFRFTYRTTTNIQGESVCPGREFIANKDGGYISSPNYPLNYGNNLNCLFTLIVPTGKKTHVEFVEMKTEYHQSCANDRLNVSSATESRIICGEGSPKASVFHGEKVNFHFLTNAQNTNKGFVIKYYFTEDETYSNDCVCPRGNSYIRVDLTKNKLLRHTDDIRFEFRTMQSSSLLLHAMGKHRDFLRVKLVQGQLKFSVDLGTGKGTITVPTGALNNGQWHSVEITRNGRRVKVSVDRSVAGIVETPGIFTKLDLRAPNALMYVAGSARRRHGSNFVGCLKNFVIDNRRPIVDALRGDPAHTVYFNPFPRCPAT